MHNAQDSLFGDESVSTPVSMKTGADAVKASAQLGRAASPEIPFDPKAPLAQRMRPLTLEDVAGQQHLIAPGKPLHDAIKSNRLHSMIFWGETGVGKTTLAEVVARACDARFERVPAVSSGVKDIREAVERAKAFAPRRTVLFIDEIHRLNKSQQDAVLPHVEDGTFILIGATNHNPSFEINAAVLSRASVYVLKPLCHEDLRMVLDRALKDGVRGLGHRPLSIAEGVCDAIARAAAGDARRALTMLERAADLARPEGDAEVIDQQILRDVAGHYGGRMDKSGDAYYGLLSACHKSIRSSRPQATLFYIAKYVKAGGDPLDIVRRLAAIATEDVGHADPKALQVVMSAWDAFLRLGPAEGERAIAFAAVYLAVAPKSNALYVAWNEALAYAEAHPDLDPPLYLQNAPTALMQELGYNAGYRYAHHEPQGYPAGDHNCWPSQTAEQVFYRPTEYGQEKQFKAMMQWRDKLDADALKTPVDS